MSKVEGHCLCLQPNMGEQITSSCTWDLGAQLKGKITGVLKALSQSDSWNWEASLGLCVGSAENVEPVGVIWATPHPLTAPRLMDQTELSLLLCLTHAVLCRTSLAPEGPIPQFMNSVDLVSRVCISGFSGPCRCKKC